MSETFDNVRALARAGKLRVSRHGLKRLAEQQILLDDLLSGLALAESIEDYPTYFTGPSVLVLSYDASGTPLHSVWGLEKGTTEPAVLVTAYRPDPLLWLEDMRSRRP